MLEKKGILVLDANAQSRQVICNILKSQHYPTNATPFLSELESYIEKEDHIAVIIDIITIASDKM